MPTLFAKPWKHFLCNLTLLAKPTGLYCWCDPPWCVSGVWIALALRCDQRHLKWAGVAQMSFDYRCNIHLFVLHLKQKLMNRNE
jgi:hypothetical protein